MLFKKNKIAKTIWFASKR